MKRLIKKLLRDDAANVGVMFALGGMAVMACCGVAIDFVGINMAKTKANAAADAAVLTLGQSASEKFELGEKNWKKFAKAASREMFDRNLRDDYHVTSFDPNVERKNNNFEATINYTFEYKSAFMGLFGKPVTRISETVAAVTAPESYMDLHFLVDMSASMGVGATAGDQHQMISNVGCAFACHVDVDWDDPNYSAVRSRGLKLRIDVVRDAIKKLVADLRSKGYDKNAVRISIDGFSNALIPVIGPTTNLSEVDAAISKIDLNNYSVGSNITYSLNSLIAKYGAGGNGSSESNRKSYIILATDGVENSVFPKYTPPNIRGYKYDPNFVNSAFGFSDAAVRRLQSPVGVSCDAAKASNHILLVAHIKYLSPPESDPQRKAVFHGIDNTVTPAARKELSACASQPDMYKWASTSQEIEQAFQGVLSQITKAKTLRLTH